MVTDLDSQLSMADHVAALSRACLFQLRQLRLVWSSLTEESAKTLVHTFVSSRLDYCNSLLYGVSDELLQKLQVIQNAAARVVTGARKLITSPRFFANSTGCRAPTHQVQVGDDSLQVSSRVGATVSSRRLCTGLVCGQ